MLSLRAILTVLWNVTFALALVVQNGRAQDQLVGAVESAAVSQISDPLCVLGRERLGVLLPVYYSFEATGPL